MEYKTAVAFIDSLIGWVDLSESNGRPKSEHARTHLEATMGLDGLIINNLYQLTTNPKVFNRNRIEKERLLRICYYLIDVGVAIKDKLDEATDE